MNAYKRVYKFVSMVHSIKRQEAYLVSIAPGEVAGANVLVGVLDALLERGEVGPVLPMLVVEVVGIGAGEDEGGDAGARRVSRFLARLSSGVG